MVDPKSVEAQLKRIKFSSTAWGRAEIRELPNILCPGEVIYECVNGVYDGGFALLVSTDMRVLLIDKKPLNYLTVEDLRFDMINEIDYSHRLLGAMITISAGNKTLHFRSYNQQRLRKLINHVQDRMSEIKKEQADHQEDQKKHLMQINQQLQAYLLAQHQQLMQMQQHNARQQSLRAESSYVKPSPELSDYLFAQSLMREFGSLGKDASASNASGGLPPQPDEARQLPQEKAPAAVPEEPKLPAAEHAEIEVQAQPTPPSKSTAPPQPDDLYADGYREIFGRANSHTDQQAAPKPSLSTYAQQVTGFAAKSLEVNPLRIAYAKLPMALRNRKFGRPSFYAPSAPTKPTSTSGHSAVA